MFTSSRGFNPICGQAPPNFIVAFPLEVLPVDPLHHLSLCRVDHELPILVLIVSQESIRADLNLALLVAVLEPQPDVLGEALALLLGHGRHDGEHDLAFGIQSIDPFLFKEHADIPVLELPDVVQAVKRVTGKPADGFGDHHVNLPRHAVLYHPIEIIPFLRVGPRNAIIGIDYDKRINLMGLAT